MLRLDATHSRRGEATSGRPEPVAEGSAALPQHRPSPLTPSAPLT
ncbi:MULTISPECIES: hypothetical protein [unclassified Streptomyces]|nr:MULTISPECIES: hypothetical protein [unclassified Streptomyces]